jgi:hypothetical protein
MASYESRERLRGTGPMTPSTAETLVADWLAGIEESFGEAAEADVIEQQVVLTGAPVRLQVAGTPMFDRLAPAFAHLTDTSGDPPALTLRVWDSPGASMDPPLPSVPEGPRGAVYYSAEGALRIAYQPGLQLLSVLDHDRGLGWFWCASAEALPYWESSAPFRQILHWWLAARNMLLLHGAAVGRPEGGVLLVGRGGSGKSTTALVCLESELLYAGDDYVAVRDDEAPSVFSLYCSGKLEPTHATRLSHLPEPSIEGDGSDDAKAVFYVRDRYPDRTCESFPLRAVLAPKIGGAETRILPLAGGAALRALAPSTLLQLHPADSEAFGRMARLVARIPTFAFELGPDIAAIPGTIDSFLEELPAA